MVTQLGTILIVVLSNNGYWMGGRPAVVTLRPAIIDNTSDWDVLWELQLDRVGLSHGQVTIHAKDQKNTVKLILPEPRLRVTLQWTYKVVDRANQKVLETGRIPINLFPSNIIDGLAERVGSKRIVVVDQPDGLPSLLRQAKVPFRQFSTVNQLVVVDADVVLIGQNMIADSPFGQSPLTELARSGVSVMIFQQNRPGRLMGYEMNRRKATHKLDWRLEHPLLADLSQDDLQSWMDNVSLVPVVQMPGDDPALAIASFPHEMPGHRAAPTDAVLLTKSIGQGRIVLCQLPLGNWNEDPRSQIFLRNALDYLLTRPEPTKAMNQQMPRKVDGKTAIETNEISYGDAR